MRNNIQPITKEVLDRFSSYLEVFKENCESKQFSWSDLDYAYSMPTNVKQALVNLKYAKRMSIGVYTALYETVEPYMARRICERIIEIQNGYRANAEQRKSKEDNDDHIEKERTSNSPAKYYVCFDKPFAGDILALRTQIIRYLATPLAANWKKLTVVSKREWLQEMGKRPAKWHPKNCSTEIEPVFYRNTVSLFEIWTECLGQKNSTFLKPQSYGKDLSYLKREARIILRTLKDWAQVDEDFMTFHSILIDNLPKIKTGEIFVRVVPTHVHPGASSIPPSYKNGLDRLSQEERTLIEKGKNADEFQKNYERLFKENLLLRNKIDEIKGLHEKSTRELKPAKEAETLFLKKLAASGVVALEIDYAQCKCETLRIEDIQISMSPNQ